MVFIISEIMIKKRPQLFCITLQTFLGTTRKEKEVEQIAIKSNGIIIHQKISNDKLVFSYEATAKDTQIVSDFFASECVQSVKKWGNKYYNMRFRLDYQIFKNSDSLYHRWIIEFKDERKSYSIYGDTLPEHAEEISNNILRMCAFSPVPNLFFKNSTELYH